MLCTEDAAEKAQASQQAAKAWKKGRIGEMGAAIAPDRPARPPSPVLLPPREMPKRHAGGSLGSRISMLHALAHIELNAIDLAWDIIIRFATDQPRAFADDWVRVADEESAHFLMLSERLNSLGAAYGDLPAHNGLWEAAAETAHDVLARLAIVPMVLEARGLDVTPSLIGKFEHAGDRESADILRIIYRDEIGHVGIGIRWFESICRIENVDSQATWHGLVKRHFRGKLKPPFNVKARQMSGFDRNYYENSR